jgi:exoribonuclease R
MCAAHRCFTFVKELKLWRRLVPTRHGWPCAVGELPTVPTATGCTAGFLKPSLLASRFTCALPPLTHLVQFWEGPSSFEQLSFQFLQQVTEAVQEVECAPDPAGRVPCGRVVYIAKRNWRHRGYAGSLKPSDNIAPGRTACVLFAPVERRFPYVRIRTQQAQALMGKRIIVVVDEWPADSPHPFGHYAGIIGTTGDLLTESQVGTFRIVDVRAVCPC